MRKPKTRSAEHPSHLPELHRLSRIIGQISGVRQMVEDKRYCPEILIQTRAIHAALRSFEAVILKRHLEHCVQSAMKSSEASEKEMKIAELVDLFRSMS